MEMFGLDLVNILLTAAFVSFWGGIFIAFIYFYSKNPYVPRKYYKVKIENKEGRWIRTCKGWPIKDKKVDYFRVQLKEFPGFKGIHMDASIMESMNTESELELVESVPDLCEATNYRPKVIPLTQKERFVNDLVEDVIKPLCVVEFKDGEETKQGYDNRALEFYKLKAKDALTRNSRIEDLNRSAAVRARIDTVRNQDERKKGGEDFISKYGPIMALIIAGLFSYLIIDGSIKAYQVTMAQQNTVMEHGYSQVIQQCGGVYHALNPPKNDTPPAKTGVQIPFVTT